MELLAGKISVVTGASRGIGAAIARRLGANGAAVAVSARTVEADQSPFAGTITETVEMIEKAGGIALPVVADLAKPDDRRRLVETAETELGPIDILVNNAAVTYFEPVATFSKRRWDLMFEVQVKAPFELVQLVLPGHAGAEARVGPQHLVGGGPSSAGSALPAVRRRRHRLRHVQGRARAVHDRPCL